MQPICSLLIRVMKHIITINEPSSDFEDNLDINGYADLIISSFSGRIDNFDYKTTDFGY